MSGTSANDYYDVDLKKARLARFMEHPGYTHIHADLADRTAVESAFATHKPRRVINLAAQAGVRYAAENPHIYVASNVTGFLHILEGCRQHDVKHLVFASTSSVYGANTAMPFSEHQSTEHPLTLYAASKKADEQMAHSYAHLYGIPCTGLRFFTVYGPWGRPDMAYYSFMAAIMAGQPLRIFGNGSMRRDFTYIDDIVDGVVAALDRPRARGRHRLYNLGNNNAASVNDLIAAIEAATGKQAARNEVPAPPGEVAETWADISESQRDLGFTPKVSLPEGIHRFADWYRHYHQA